MVWAVLFFVLAAALGLRLWDVAWSSGVGRLGSFVLGATVAFVSLRLGFWPIGWILLPLALLVVLSMFAEMPRPPLPGWPYLLTIVAGAAVTLLGLQLRGQIRPQDMFQDLALLNGLASIPVAYLTLRMGWMSRNQVIDALILVGSILASFCILMTIAQGGPLALITSRLGANLHYNSNLLASFLDMTVPLALWRALQTGANRVQYRNLMPAGLQLGALILTGTRGSLPTMAICAGLILWTVRKRKSLLFLSIGMVFLVLALLAPLLIDRILHPTIADMGSNWGRVRLFQASMEVLHDQAYFWGIGFNVFHAIKYDYGFPFWFDRGEGFSSHNAHLEILLGWGLIAFMGWFGLLWRQVRLHAKRVLRRRRFDLDAAILVSIFCFGLHGLVESEVAHPPYLWAAGLLLGLSLFHSARSPT